MDAVIDRLGGYFGSHEAEDDFDDSDVADDGAGLEPLPSPIGQDERRMQVRAYNHWASLLGDRAFPHIDDLDPAAAGDFGPHSLLLDLTDDVDDPRLAYIGEELRAECGDGATLDQLSRVPGRSVLSRITDHYMQILANQAPIGFEAEFENAAGASLLYRGILLPYSSDDSSIDHIYGVINWKEMADQETADALLLELDQALEPEDEAIAHEEGAEDAEDDVLELGTVHMMELVGADGADLPRPAFGSEPTPARAESPTPARPAGTSLRGRLDALGNPVGGSGAEEPADEWDDFDGGMKTAADYGLPDWDEEDEGEEDVDGVVDPLADEDASSSLVALVNRGDRTKKAVNLALGDEMPAPGMPAIPQAYEPPPAPVAVAVKTAFAAPEAPVALPEPAETAAQADSATAIEAHAEAEGLYDSLAAARELAQAAQNTEDRSRKTLYEAVGRAYDFSIEAQDDPAGFGELLADNDLTMQDRAPMTPVVKLVFGADYDKTRLTEYAAVLMHGHRLGVERGALARFLREAEGGLKGVVQAERRARKEEQGQSAPEETRGIRAKLAEGLRGLAPGAIADLAADGPEFALVMVRRSPDGTLSVIGEVPEDIPLVERAARKLLG